MDPNIIIEKIHTLHGSKDSLQIKDSDRVLKEFQNSQQAWMFSNQVLSSPHYRQDLTVLLYAAQTLKIKVQHDLHELDAGAFQSLKDSLVAMLSGGSQVFAKIVITQLCLALVSLLSQEQRHLITEDAVSPSVMEKWMSIFNQIFNALSGNKRVLLQFLTVLPEEMHVQLLSPCTDQLLDFLFRLYTDEKNKNSSDLMALVIGCVCGWTRTRLISAELLAKYPLTFTAFEALRFAASCEDDDLFESSADLICELALELKSNYESSSNAMALMQDFYNQLQFVSTLLQESDAEDSARLKTLVRIFVSVGELFMPFILKQPEQMSQIIEAVLKCTSISDLELVPMTFNFWGDIADSVIQVSGIDVSNAEAPRLPLNCHTVINHAFGRLLELLIGHLKYPDESKQWTATDRDDFRDLRHTIGNVLKDCCLVLGEKDSLKRPYMILEPIITGQSTLPWQSIEAAMFALRAMGSEVSIKEDEIMPKIMDAVLSLDASSASLQNVSQEQRNKIQYASTLVVGRYSEWSRYHPQFIERELNFISTGFGMDEVAAASSLALKYLCESCSELMIPYLSQLHPFYVQSQQRLSSYEMRELTEAMALIVNSMPPQEKGPALESFCRAIIEELSKISQPTFIELDQAKTAKSIEDMFDRLSIFFKVVTTPATFGLFRQIWPVIETLSINRPSEVAFESICKLLRTIIVSVQPQEIVQVLPQIMTFTVRTFENTTYPCFMWIAGQVINRFHTIDTENTNRFFVAIVTKALQKYAEPQTHDFDPQSYEDFANFISSGILNLPGTLASPLFNNVLRTLIMGLTRPHYVVQEASILTIKDLLESTVNSGQQTAKQLFGEEAAQHLVSNLLSGIVGANEHGSQYTPHVTPLISSIFFYLALIHGAQAVAEWSRQYLQKLKQNVAAFRQKITEQTVNSFLQSISDVLNDSASTRTDGLKYAFASLSKSVKSRRRHN